jgi:formylglycine-generating enzyme required for sulfatase activity
MNSTCTPESFIGKVNALLGTTTFRMPTEAEWERAARGGASTSTPFSFATPASWSPGCGSFPEAEPYMWWCGNADLPNTSTPGTRPVGTKLPNPYGLHDVHGNVWEWVSDWHGDYSSGSQTDPSGPEYGPGRVIRGGGWQLYARYCRTAARALGDPFEHKDSNGFRLASSQ